LRVESLFGSPPGWRGRRGTLDAIVDGLEAGREVTVFTDRVVSPSYIVDVAAATRHLVEHGAGTGLYHCVNSGFATWRDVAVEPAGILEVKARLKAITMRKCRCRLRGRDFLRCQTKNSRLLDLACHPGRMPCGVGFPRAAVQSHEQIE